MFDSDYFNFEAIVYLFKKLLLCMYFKRINSIKPVKQAKMFPFREHETDLTSH